MVGAATAGQLLIRIQDTHVWRVFKMFLLCRHAWFSLFLLHCSFHGLQTSNLLQLTDPLCTNITRFVSEIALEKLQHHRPRKPPGSWPYSVHWMGKLLLTDSAFISSSFALSRALSSWREWDSIAQVEGLRSSDFGPQDWLFWKAFLRWMLNTAIWYRWEDEDRTLNQFDLISYEWAASQITFGVRQVQWMKFNYNYI